MDNLCTLYRFFVLTQDVLTFGFFRLAIVAILLTANKSNLISHEL